jgi:hypothetical protein
MSSQLAAISEGVVSGFGSAGLRPSSPFPTGDAGLTFANTGNPGNVLGKLGTRPCIGDYFFKHTLATTTDPGANGAGVNTSAKQAYFHTGNMTLPALDIQDGASIAIYVDGNLGITGPITLHNANSGWSSINDVPSIFIIVKGNIYIDSSVTNLDGVYIAQSNGAAQTGIIDTCAAASAWSSISLDSLLGSCQSQLNVNGAFISQNVKFHRAYASVRNSQGGERPAGGFEDCTQNGAPGGTRSAAEITFDCSAEIFRLTPEVFLGVPQISQENGPTAGKFDYITSLSPVL